MTVFLKPAIHNHSTMRKRTSGTPRHSTFQPIHLVGHSRLLHATQIRALWSLISAFSDFLGKQERLGFIHEGFKPRKFDRSTPKPVVTAKHR
ncbi:hypothetical protein AVEN_63223-1 [Araneus ventricosus]|uniref:Uncharacterized protein n=1 Tax=Araneus ventricosus TaxID=182803 RepID=A0A4Y2B1Q5_ARAVE|nr:hypothetical protein AVEN_63223-1 [Araneus ventricosus]